MPGGLGEHVVALGPPFGKPLLASQRVRPGPFADQERFAGTVGVLQRSPSRPTSHPAASPGRHLSPSFMSYEIAQIVVVVVARDVIDIEHRRIAALTAMRPMSLPVGLSQQDNLSPLQRDMDRLVVLAAPVDPPARI